MTHIFDTRERHAGQDANPRNGAETAASGLPPLIQGGMGVRISGWKLARATAGMGAIGVISTVGLRQIVVEEIRGGDRDAIDTARRFPIPRYVDDLLSYAPGGDRHRKPIPMDSPDPHKCALPRRLAAISAFVEVSRAKQGHRGMVGANVMWKLALTALPSIYGAMLAGVDALLCGAGVPMELPEIVRRMRCGEDLCFEPLHGTKTSARLDISRDHDSSLFAGKPPPRLIPILSNYAFPKRIVDIWNRAYDGARPDAFVLENHEAGGHNATPRNKVAFDEQDDVDAYFEKVVEIGVPVYIAGSGSTRADFLRWRERGAHGIQVGSRFALCAESGMREDLRLLVIERNRRGENEIVTDPRLSSTGYPFKYVRLPGILPEPAVYEKRRRICNLGYLQQSRVEERPDGTQTETYLCPAMPVRQYERLGGDAEDTENKVCLCNGLLATTGLRDTEPPIVTLGHNGLTVKENLTARQVMEDILTPEYVAEQERILRLEPTHV